MVALVIDDLGNRWKQDLDALDLPGVMTISILPHTPHARRLARMAHRRDKEVLLHVPMESLGRQRMGPGGLTQAMGRDELVRTVARGLAAVPYARGVSNHMGSLLTQRPQSMRWLMQTLREAGDLFFVDTRTIASSVAYEMARGAGLPAVERDVFLDHDRSLSRIVAELDRLVRVAKLKGAALGIGHPHPETLAVLRRELPHLEQRGVRLVPVSALVELNRSVPPWRLYLSPSLKAAKSSKLSPSSICCAEPESPL
jgi:polysaccharide deacetylase 2 family uncharacterized protein YibQ